jgi:hypothetical protein
MRYNPTILPVVPKVYGCMLRQQLRSCPDASQRHARLWYWKAAISLHPPSPKWGARVASALQPGRGRGVAGIRKTSNHGCPQERKWNMETFNALTCNTTFGKHTAMLLPYYAHSRDLDNKTPQNEMAQPSGILKPNCMLGRPQPPYILVTPQSGMCLVRLRQKHSQLEQPEQCLSQRQEHRPESFHLHDILLLLHRERANVPWKLPVVQQSKEVVMTSNTRQTTHDKHAGSCHVACAGQQGPKCTPANVH